MRSTSETLDRRDTSDTITLRRLAVGAALLGAFAILAIAPDPGEAAVPDATIAEVVDSPASYANQQVTLVGTVDPAPIAYGADSLYTLRQDGRPISVLGRAPAPAAGAQITVTGELTVRPPDEEFTFPPVLLEIERAPQF
jgi:hypothetical protein